ncbi:DUF5131 family protein [Sphingomonas sp.]|jgi:protein gp37|uniref:DUF5131 family protein n=1 Tax=Sphingomonas sp. TaxID=28214 RepID=UPI00261813E5|nr:phage Gp37/Gp68 family protein [Sphingomonas sp.]MDF2603480.1 phage Gp37Gp68 [Sphingomonas sp.]
MADTTKIEWTDATWNIINGCSVHTPGCTNCYAMLLAGTRLAHHPSRAGLTAMSKAGPVWTGEVRLHEPWLTQPLEWTKPRDIFVCAHGDLFHEAVSDAMLDRVFAVIALCAVVGRRHRFQVLTKRSGRMRHYVNSLAARAQNIAVHAADLTADAYRSMPAIVEMLERGPLPNVWLGVSTEDQRRADERIPDLLATPAAMRWISAEPLLGSINLEPWLAPEKTCQGCDDGEGYGNRCSSDRVSRDEQCPWKRAVQIVTEHGPFAADGEPSAVTCAVRTLDWVVVGGESGRGARPMHPAWARALRDQCAAADVPFLFKQWGEWAPVCAIGLDDLDEQLYHPAPARDPEAIRRCKVGQLVMQASGRVFPVDQRSGIRGEDPAKGDFAFLAGTGAMTFLAVGKRRAGRLLDGVQHDGAPA